MNNYAPKAGSLPARLLEHLRANGGTMTRAEIANGFAIESKNVHSNLETIIKHGLLVMHQVEGQTTRFGLPGSAPEVTAPVPPASMTMMKSPNSLLIERKTTAVNKRERSLVALAASAPATEAPPPPIAALWEDGDIVLYGLQINADDTVTLSGHQAKRVHRFMERCFGPNE